MRNQRWLLTGAAAGGLVLAACGGGAKPAAMPAAGSAMTAPSHMAMLKSGKTSMGKVLTNAMGRTLYWFALDTPAASKCTGSCLAVWPPVTGTPRLAGGVHAPGKLGTIRRPGGPLQATYDHHPLYTYAGDRAPGQARGNGIIGFGGRWHAVMLPGGGMHASHSPGGGGGY